MNTPSGSTKPSIQNGGCSGITSKSYATRTWKFSGNTEKYLAFLTFLRFIYSFIPTLLSYFNNLSPSCGLLQKQNNGYFLGIQKAINNRQKLDAQLNENKIVLEVMYILKTSEKRMLHNFMRFLLLISPRN